MSKTGRCLCGAVTYTLARAPETYGACHCSMCRRFTGGIELGVQTRPKDIAWGGEEHIKVYTSSTWAERGFCSICGSSLFWRLTANGPMKGMMSVTAGTLDSLEGMTLATEVYVDHKPDSYAFAGDRPRMTEADVLAMVEQTKTVAE